MSVIIALVTLKLTERGITSEENQGPYSVLNTDEKYSTYLADHEHIHFSFTFNENMEDMEVLVPFLITTKESQNT